MLLQASIRFGIPRISLLMHHVSLQRGSSKVGNEWVKTLLKPGNLGECD